MSEVKSYRLPWAGRDLVIEIGRVAGQASGSCTVRYGDTVVLVTAVRGFQTREGIDYFPLMVDYEERFYAAGKIGGSRFIKREGRPSEEAVLVGRLIDRALRPLFDDRIRVDVQVMVTVLSIDESNDPDVPAMVGAACALMISDIPWNGPLVGVRMGLVDGKLVTNPTYPEREKTTLDVVVAGTESEIVMLEAGAKEVDDDKAYEAIEEGLKQISPVIELLKKIQKEVGKKKANLVPEEVFEKKELATRAELLEQLKTLSKGKVEPLLSIKEKDERVQQTMDVEKSILETIEKEKGELSETHKQFLHGHFEQMTYEAFREMVLKKEKRPDGRKLDEVRPISMEVGVLPRTHGSAIFNRGETQALSIVTLGAPGEEQLIDGMEIVAKKHYMHHYNMPPYSTGEVKPMRSTGRREIGHGALAEKAILPMLPPKEEFAYTIRVVSEILSSNGSTSQASVCGSSLSLMDAGVPLRKPVAGISIGLVVDENDKDNFKLLTDIQGIEDHAGCMDFKVAGTRDGITAIQLDIKLTGITMAVVRGAIDQAKKIRLNILDMMKAVIEKPRPELSPYAPRIESFRIDPEKIGELIGPGGKVINKIIEETDVTIDIEDDGMVHVTSTKPENMKKALDIIQSIIKEIQVGEVYEGKVTQIMKDRFSGTEIGAIVEILPNRDGMVHISQLSMDRVAKVTDVVNVGDTVKVKVTDVDKERGRIGLSIRALLPGGDTMPDRPQRGSRPPFRGGDRGGRRRDFR